VRLPLELEKISHRHAPATEPVDGPMRQCAVEAQPPPEPPLPLDPQTLLPVSQLLLQQSEFRLQSAPSPAQAPESPELPPEPPEPPAELPEPPDLPEP
jgi:hypothetical protein